MTTDPEVAWLVFRVGVERFALDVASVEEAADASALEHVPQLPEGVVGLLRWRGEAHQVWSLAKALRVSPGAPATVLFLRSDSGWIAVAVDDAEDMITLPGSRVCPLPGVESARGLVLGGLQVDGVLATVIDVAVLAAAVTGRLASAGPQEA